jgi:hypothetical protein
MISAPPPDDPDNDKPRDPRAAGTPPWLSPPPDLPVKIAPPSGPGRAPRATAEPGFEALAGFLESDLQGARAGLAHLLAQLDRVAAGTLGGYQRSGNAFSLRILRTVAIVQPLHDERIPDARIDLPLLRRVLLAWREALQ